MVVFRGNSVSFLEVVLVQTILVVSEKFLSVQELLDSFVFSVVIKISLEIVSVTLLLFGELTCEYGVR